MNVLISRCWFTEDGTDLFKIACRTRSTLFFFLIRPIKFLVCVVVAAVAGFNAQAPFRHITDLHQGSLNYIQRPRVSFFALSRFFSIFNHIFVNPLKNTEPGKSNHFSQAIFSVSQNLMGAGWWRSQATEMPASCQWVWRHWKMIKFVSVNSTCAHPLPRANPEHLRYKLVRTVRNLKSSLCRAIDDQ